MAVLLLELSYGLNHNQGDRSGVRKSVEKMLNWLDAMRHTDDIVERAYRVVIKILQQHKFKAIFSDILGESKPVHEHTQHASSSIGHAHPTKNPPGGKTSQIPPSDWYSGPYAANTQPEGDVSNLAMKDPQLAAGFGDPQEQQILPQMTQMPPQTEQYQYLEYPYPNQFMFSNPFMTSYDQNAPFSLTREDIWPSLGSSSDGGFAEQQGAYANFPYMIGQDASGGPQQPQ